MRSHFDLPGRATNIGQRCKNPEVPGESATSVRRRHCKSHEIHKSFDPALPAMLHDRVNDQLVEWSPKKSEAAYRKSATELEPGVISFEGRTFDGWRPVVIDPDSPA